MVQIPEISNGNYEDEESCDLRNSEQLFKQAFTTRIESQSHATGAVHAP